MTTVYGVTFIGAREQIEKQLKDRGDISQEDCWGAASYLAKQVWAFRSMTALSVTYLYLRCFSALVTSSPEQKRFKLGSTFPPD